MVKLLNPTKNPMKPLKLEKTIMGLIVGHGEEMAEAARQSPGSHTGTEHRNRVHLAPWVRRGRAGPNVCA